jgi:DNA-binding response OmpR family regulator
MAAKNIAQAWEQVSAALQGKLEQPYRIFVADGDEDMCHLNAEVLIEAGYDVGVATDGVGAWNAIQLASYDLLVTDNRLARISGLELLKNIRIASIDLPVIIVTEAPPEKKFRLPPWLTIEAVLFKPYSADELLAMVRNVLHTIHSVPDQIAGPQDRPPADEPRL